MGAPPGPEEEGDEVDRFWALAFPEPESLDLSYETEYMRSKKVADPRGAEGRVVERAWRLWGWDEGAGRVRWGGRELEREGEGRRWGVADPYWGREEESEEVRRIPLLPL